MGKCSSWYVHSVKNYPGVFFYFIGIFTTEAVGIGGILTEPPLTVRFMSGLCQVLVRFWSGSGQILVRFWSGSGQVLVRFWSGSGQILVRFWSGSGQVACYIRPALSGAVLSGHLNNRHWPL